MEFSWSLFILLVFFAWILRRWHDRHSILLAMKIPSNKWQLLFGFGYVLTAKDSIKTLTKAIHKYGRTFMVYIGPYPTFATTDPETLKEILTSQKCVNKNKFFYDRFTAIAGGGTISINEPKWSLSRKILNPAFTNKNLVPFVSIFNEKINALIKTIDNDMECNVNTPLIDYFRKFTVEIATRTTLGREFNNTRFAERGIENIRQGLEYAFNVMFNFWFCIDFIRVLAGKTMYRGAVRALAVTRSLITESVQISSVRDDVGMKTALDYVNDATKLNKIDDELAIANLMHLFGGAFETTSTSIYFVIILLAMHPEYQQQAYQEICDVFPDTDEDNFEVTYDNINQLTYLDMVIQEMMRIFPVIPLVSRMVTGGSLELSSGITLPDGQPIIIDIFNLHRSPEIWGPDADQFNPDHFLPANMETKHPYAFIPFTKGKRFCIGWRYAELSLKVALCKLIRRYSFSTPAKMEDFHLENHISLQLLPDPPLTIKRRSKKQVAA